MKKSFLLFIIIITASCAVKKTKRMENIISDEELKSSREFFNELGEIYRSESEVQKTKKVISGVVCYTFTPPKVNNNRLMLYAHGGSFALGGIESHEAMMTHLAKTAQTEIVFVEYGLAPENPFPKGVNDFFEVYKDLKSKNGNKKIFVVGDSAGCGIILSCLGNLKNEKFQMPNGVIFISPWLNLYCDSESYLSNKDKDPIIKKEELVKYANLYRGNSDLKNASPSNLNFSRFPPNLVTVGKGEVLLQDSKDFNEKVKKVQSKSFLMEFKNVTHVWPLTDINSESTKRLLVEISNFLDNETN